MSTLVLLLATVITVPGIGPEMVSGEVEQRLDLRGRWEGTWKSGGLTYRIVANNFFVEGTTLFRNGMILVRPVHISDERAGFARVRETNEVYLAIYKQMPDMVLICIRKERFGRPTSFRDGVGQELLILHRVKPRK